MSPTGLSVSWTGGLAGPSGLFASLTYISSSPSRSLADAIFEPSGGTSAPRSKAWSPLSVHWVGVEVALPFSSKETTKRAALESVALPYGLAEKTILRPAGYQEGWMLCGV